MHLQLSSAKIVAILSRGRWVNGMWNAELSEMNMAFILMNCGLVVPYGDIDLDQHWLQLWLFNCHHQAITWINVDI